MTYSLVAGTHVIADYCTAIPKEWAQFSDLHFGRCVAIGGFAGQIWESVRQKEVNEYSDQGL